MSISSGDEGDCDVAIIGGGGMGGAAAYFLRQFGGPGLSITVFEPDPTYARASTALAAGGIRQQFSTPENIRMSQFGFQFFEQIGEALAVDGEQADIGLTPRPYLRLADERGVDALRRDYDLQAGLGAEPTWLDRADLARRFPWMSTTGVAAAILGGPREGMFDPYGMLMAFRRTNRALGVRYHPAAVTGFDFATDGRTIEGVRLSDGGVVRCGLAVNAAGPRAAGVAATAGLALPVTAMKAESFVFRAERGPADCPIVLDRVGGVQFKPEGAYFVGAAPGGGAAAGPDDFAGEPGRFEDEVWPRLAARVPGFERLRLERSWVGHIELNTLDFNPVIGLHPDRPNLYFLAGFSGHGAQHAPAGGRAIAELIVDGAYRTLDLSRFGYARVLSGEALREEA